MKALWTHRVLLGLMAGLLVFGITPAPATANGGFC